MTWTCLLLWGFAAQLLGNLDKLPCAAERYTQAADVGKWFQGETLIRCVQWGLYAEKVIWWFGWPTLFEGFRDQNYCYFEDLGIRVNSRAASVKAGKFERARDGVGPS